MKPEQIYEQLKDFAEKLNITVKEKKLDLAGIHVKSGLCKIKGNNIFIMDKKKSVQKKNEMLASCLGKIQHDHVYAVPFIREFICNHKDNLGD